MLACGERHRLVDGFGRTLARTFAIAKLRDTFFRYGKGRRCRLGLQDERSVRSWLGAYKQPVLVSDELRRVAERVSSQRWIAHGSSIRLCGGLTMRFFRMTIQGEPRRRTQAKGRPYAILVGLITWRRWVLPHLARHRQVPRVDSVRPEAISGTLRRGVLPENR